MSVTKEQVFDFIDSMTILEMSKFIKEFEERYDVTAAAPIAVAAVPGAAGAGAPAQEVEEKTSFDVIINVTWS
jgi:large subunit ribosomal protein L7/L12